MRKGDGSVRRRIRWGLLPVLVLLLCSLSGCLFQSADELYSLPQLSDDYYNLQACLDAILTDGVEYAAPVSGSQQQAVQLVDLTGDGEKEAVVFVKTGDERPLKTYIFQKTDDTYSQVCVIEGEGSAFQSVEYVELNDAGSLELVICRQVSDQVPQALSVYSPDEDLTVTELLNVSCTEYLSVDLTGDGVTDLLLLSDDENASGAASLYSWNLGMLEKTGEAAMSTASDAVRRMITGTLEDGAPAVFVTSTWDESSIITDVFALREGQLVNVCGDTTSEARAVRNYYVYAQDLDDDGAVELPQPLLLPAVSEDAESYWLIQWCSLSLDGTVTGKLLTYHNYAAGWYLELPMAWRDRITVWREDSTYVFAEWTEDGETELLFSIGTAASGEEIPADSTLLLEQNGASFYLTLEADAADRDAAFTAENLSSGFHLIQTDWNTGEMQ